MSAQDIASLLDLGLTSLQSRTYISLLKQGTCRASLLSQLIGIVRPEAYRILGELSTRGLVQRNPGRPSTYTAVSPSRAVSILLHRYTKRLELLEQGKDTLIRSLSTYPAKTERPDQRFSLIMGGSNVLLRIRQMIDDAKYDYSVITSKFGLKRIRDEGIASAIFSAKRRNVRIRLISEIDDSNIVSAKFLSPHIELRKTRDVLFYLDIVDEREMVLGPAISDEELNPRNRRESDLWTNNAQFILGMHALFERLWKSSPKFVCREDSPRTPGHGSHSKLSR